MLWNDFTLSIISVLWTCKLPEHVWAKQRSDCLKLFGFPFLRWRFLGIISIVVVSACFSTKTVLVPEACRNNR